MAKSPNMGRQKIKIAKIENKSNLQVTFSKRRFGLYKKAHELSTLCGVELALIIFSPAGKVFSFGTTKVDCIIDKYIHSSASSGRLASGMAHKDNTVVQELNSQLTLIESELEAVKKRGELFDGMLRQAIEHNRLCWWREEYPHPIGLRELEQLKCSMEELKTLTTEQASKLMAEAFLSQNVNNGGHIYHF